MQQQFTIIGVSRRQGLSQKTQRNYDIAIVKTLQPLMGTDANFVASGFKEVEMSCDTNTAMKAMQYGFPCEVVSDLEIRGDAKLGIVKMEPVTAKVTQAKAS